MQSVPPARPIFEIDGLDAHLKANAATAAEIAAVKSLADDGYAVIDLPGVSGDQIDAIREAVAPLFEGGNYNRVQDAWLHTPAIGELARASAILRLLELAYGRKPFPFQTLNFYRGSRQGAHSDAIHFFARPAGFMAGVWIALEDIHPDSGPLFYYPGSHKLPSMTPQNMGITKSRPTVDDYNAINPTHIAALVDEHGLKAETRAIKKGQAIIWAANLLHGGEVVKDPSRTRQSLVVHYFFDGCDYFTPMWSSPSFTWRRLPFEVGSRAMKWPKVDGRPIWPGMRTLANALRHRLARQPRRFER